MSVIPAMDHITNCLNHQTGKTYHPSLVVAMKLAIKKMEHYHSLMDSSPTYWIAMVLHPGMKLEYFHNQNWKEERIDEAERLIWIKYIEQYEKEADEASPMPLTSSNMNHDGRFASFGDLSVTTAPHVSKIQEYLNHPVENVKDPLKWWDDNQKNYPKIHCMALGYLSIPGKSHIWIYGNNTNMLLSNLLHWLNKCSHNAIIFSHPLKTTSPLLLFKPFSALGNGHVVIWLSLLMW